MKKFGSKSPKFLPILFSVAVVGLTSLVRGDANDALLAGQTSTKISYHSSKSPSFRMGSVPTDTELDDWSELMASLPSAEEAELLESIDPSVWNAPDLYRDKRYDELFGKTSSIHTPVFEYTSAGGLRSKNAFCHRFIDPDGKLGVYGAIINNRLDEKHLQSATTPLLDDDFIGMEKAPAVCPKWRELSLDDRKKFLIWTFAAIAHYESTCGANPKTRTGIQGMPVKKNGKIVRYRIAIGLLQLEKAVKDRSFRGISSCNVSEKEIAQAPGNLRCGVDIMEWLIISNPSKPAASIYRGPGMQKGSYWEKLRHDNGGLIGMLMRKYKPCYSR